MTLKNKDAVADIGSQRAKLSATKQALLEKRLQSRLSQGTQQPVKTLADMLPQVIAQPADRHEPFPLTDVQQAYWIGRHGDFELGNVATHGYFEIDVPSLDPRQFERAWQQLIDRHEMLRAVLRADGQQQILAEVPPYEVQVVDLRSQPAAAVTQALDDIRTRLSHQILPAEQYPLFDIQLVQIEAQKVRICLSLDVLIGDGWSFEILLQELAELIQHPDNPLPAHEISFRDYVLTESKLKQTDIYKQAEAYWQGRLDSLPPAPELPLQQAPGAISKPEFKRRSHKLSPQTWQRLKQKAADADLTTSSLILSAFTEVLSRWSRHPHFTINLTLFNRLPLHPKINEIMGDFTSLTLLEVDHSQPASFVSKAQQIQGQLWQDLEHRYFSGVQVLREIARRHERPMAALMPIIFTSMITQDRLARETSIADLAQDESGYIASSLERLGELAYMVTQTPQVYLDHQVYESEGQLVLNWDCVEALFPPGLLDDLFAAYCELLDNLANDDARWQSSTADVLPTVQQQRLKALELPILSETGLKETELHGQKCSLTAKNASRSGAKFGASSGAKSQLLHTLFFEQVKERSHQPAVITPSKTLTYQELNDRVCALSHHLKDHLTAQGTQPNPLIAIVMKKGWEQVVAVLSILAAGAAYVPIDPALPTQRKVHLLQQTNARCILTQSALSSSVDDTLTVFKVSSEKGSSENASSENASSEKGSSGENNNLSPCPPVISVDTFTDQLESPTLSPPTPSQQTTDLAYILYTSGSTGQPKGVMIDHQGAVNTLLDINQRFNITAKDRIFGLSSLSFDLSVYDIFGSLAAGGAIVIPHAAHQKDPSHWLTLLQEHNVTVWNAVPALMQMLVEYASAEQQLPQLKLVMMSGDWIPLTLPQQIRALCPSAQRVSLGGATEASIWSILYPIDSVAPDWKSIPYGRAMDNQQFYVLNSALQSCPVWVPGQLYIGGIGLALGYWRNPEKTQASFITHPKTGEQLYRTGDLGRYLPDGNIEFLGREDFQVKVSGYRIELGEIETVLQQHPWVKTAIATARGKSSESKRLGAYLLLEDAVTEKVETEKAKTEETKNETLTPLALSQTLRDFLQDKLPDYMIPSSFKVMETLPLTANGKVNRQALPNESPADDIPSEVAYAPPDGELEQQLTAIVQTILQLERLSVHDNFFDLGGNSLKLIQVHVQLKAQLSCDVPIVEMFRYPTIRKLSQYLSHSQLVGSALQSTALQSTAIHSTTSQPSTTSISQADPHDQANLPKVPAYQTLTRSAHRKNSRKQRKTQSHGKQS